MLVVVVLVDKDMCMNNANQKTIFDSNHNSLSEGDNVQLLSASEDLLRGLPLSDQSAIQDQVNKIMAIQSFNEYGHVELEFTDVNGNMHFIWVEPKDVEKV